MRSVLRGKKLLSIFMILVLIISSIGFYPLQVGAAASSEVGSVGDVQTIINETDVDHGYSVTKEVYGNVYGNTDTVPADHLRVHYNRTDGKYADLGLWLWGDVVTPSANWALGATPFPAGQVDNYGAFVDVPLISSAKTIKVIVVKRVSGDKDGGDKNISITTSATNEVWIKEGSDQVTPYEPVDIPANTVRVHYQRADNNYSPYGIWNWEDVAIPSDSWSSGATPFPAGQVDKYGAYVDISLKDNAKKIGFFVVHRTLGNEDKEGNRSFNLLDRHNQLWIKQGDNTVYVSPFGEVPTGLVSAEILSESKLLVNFTMTDGLEEGALKSELKITDKNDNVVTVNSVHITSSTAIEVITTPFLLENAPLRITYSGTTVSAVTGWRMIDEMYNYEGDDLGATYEAGSVMFKLWAPKASSVVANVYNKDDAVQLLGNINLTKGDKGVWSAMVAPRDLVGASITDLKGYFYQYEVTNNGVTTNVLDPYAKSMAEFRVNTKGDVGPDGDVVGKAAIVDLSGTDPEGFDFANINGYKKREDAIIWEIHVRDFTSDPAIENDLNSATWGSFDAFKSKLEYIQSLGVTHIQLLPVMAWYYGDEAKMDQRVLNYSTKFNEYNWGYDPHNYFSPDGAYSEDPTDPELRIKELKNMIDAIHDAGMGVVLDVVYTHMAKASFLDDIVPDYYAFQDANGNNIGGFGNNLATNHKMAEKLMVDSVKYWFDEYKIDGMRWDMMGDATYDAVQNAYDAAAAINPKALFIGEGWKTFGGAASDPSLAGKGADQDWMDKTDSVGVFSDEIRNELKSGFGNEGEPRFITGGARDINVILNNIKAQPSNTADDDPGDMVQYIEAHDNLPLYDIIAQSIKKNPSIPANDQEILKRVRLGNMLVLTSQGTAFLHAGQEYGRTKQWKGQGKPEQKYHELADEAGKVFGYFVHDSYDSSDAINMFDWNKATNEVQYPENNTTREYTAGLIALRKSTDAFRLGDKALVDSNVTLISAPEMKSRDLIIGYKNKAIDGTGNYYVFLNADSTSRTLTLSEDLTTGKVLADNDEAGVDEVTTKSGFVLTANSITLDPLTAVIIKQDTAAVIPPIDHGNGNKTGKDGSGVASGSGTASGNNKLTQRNISEELLKNGKEKVTIDLGDKENGVLLPLKSAEFVGSKPIVINKGNFTVEVPPSLLKAIQESIAADQSEGAIISFKMDEVEESVAQSLIGKSDSSTIKLKLASKMFNFSLSVITKDGKEVKIDRFVTPITLIFNVDPSADKKLLGVYFIRDNGELEYVGGYWENSKLKVDVYHFSKYAVLEYNKSFADLEGHWAQTAVKELTAKHVVNGTTDSTFSPEQLVTRAEFAAMLVRALNLNDQGSGVSSFTDVKSSAWYASAVATAYHSGLVKGKNEFTFAPQETISREEMAVMILRAYHVRNSASTLPNVSNPSFIDEQLISSWAIAEVRAATTLGLLNGQSKNKFVPQADTSRAESAQAMMNLLNKIH
ncbi:pullulanase [Paenibacillus macquariensis]|uniref:pullulanase n=1 Tax=Paenibacillus macquariensis TaxID=948756 RepID=A0ABY1K3D6_9BACL|nr:pullulanase [Paenibacillus macquariensis]MEC0090338.1 pullulanase [Paenibacillus macquariensis]OAB39693.1 pullulanase [Paenibacillus macquariensis subsp. macquariensis]SIR19630.1 pullulanase, extracellular [Paenibacillus macquariensis]